MKKIIWITSFPKSGNTWMRYLLANYFYNNTKKFNPKIISKIEKIHLPKDMPVRNNEGKLSINNVSNFWIPAQEKLQQGDIKFIKNHNANLKIQNNNFTTEQLTLAIIHIVRDPRDVVISSLEYWGLKSYDEMIEKICNQEFLIIYDKDNPTSIEVTGSWKVNFLSWHGSLKSIPKILIKYEDLVMDTELYFSKVINFLSEFMNFIPDQDKIKFSVKNSSFEKLSKAEDLGNFEENVQKSGKFFRKGKPNQYKNLLNKNQIIKIENAFKREMKYLGYL